MQVPGFRRIASGVASVVMRKAVSVLFVFLASIFSFAQGQPPAQTPNQPSVQFMPLEQIRAGMKGVAYTVFEGTQPEPMDLEVLGVLKNLNGPRSDLILVR